MGRIQRKKDPSKKKALRETKTETDTAETSSGEAPAQPKLASVAKKSAVSSKAAKPAVQEQNFLHKSIQFLREVKVELKKVTWPSRKQTMGSTVVVLVLVIIISLFLGVVDFGLSSLIQWVLP